MELTIPSLRFVRFAIELVLPESLPAKVKKESTKTHGCEADDDAAKQEGHGATCAGPLDCQNHQEGHGDEGSPTPQESSAEQQRPRSYRAESGLRLSKLACAVLFAMIRCDFVFHFHQAVF